MMSSTRSIIVNTPFLPAFGIFLLLVLAPTLSFFFFFKTPFSEGIKALPEAYRNAAIPSITYQNGEARSNGDQPFIKEIPMQGNPPIYFIVDTAEKSDPALEEKLKTSYYGVIIQRHQALLFSGAKKQSAPIPYPQSLNITLDDQFIETLVNKTGFILFLVATFFVAIFHTTGKLIQWGMLSLYYSSKAKRCGGGQYSLATWILVPPTLVQVIFYGVNKPCCSCGLYFILLIVCAIWFDKQLVVPKTEN